MSKKMCPKKIFTPNKAGAHVPEQGASVASMLQYTLPEYRQTKGCDYIEFYAYDPAQAKMRRKRIQKNHIKLRTGLNNRRN